MSRPAIRPGAPVPPESVFERAMFWVIASFIPLSALGFIWIALVR